jgi:Uma2 family endonuclease
MTVTEFVAWAERTDGRWQLEEGEPVAMAAPSDMHALLQANVGGLLFAHLRAVGSACRVRTGPGIVPAVDQTTNVRVPDLAVVCRPASADRRLVSDPLLVIEILSPSNERETRSNVRAFCGIGSMREVVILHSQAMMAELLRRAPEGQWPGSFEVVEGPRAVLRLDSIGASFALADIYESVVL